MIYNAVNILLRFKTSMLRSDLCIYSDAYIVANRTKDLLAAVANENDKVEKNVALIMFQLDHAIQKLTVDGRDLDIVMPMYNMLEYSQNRHQEGS